jgi:hypothetical protein
MVSDLEVKVKAEKIEKLKWELHHKRERLRLYYDQEAKMLTGGAQSYSLGSRSKTNYQMSLDQLRAAIKQLEDEIRELEGLISGCNSRKVVSIIPRF